MAPPRSRRSAILDRCSMVAILLLTFAPPIATTSGLSGDSRTPSSAWSSFFISSPPAASSMCLVTPTLEACARWALANASST